MASADLHDASENYLGAFAVNGEFVAGNVRSGNVASSAQFRKANFLASKSKAIYSDDTNTVQPLALQALIIIKAWSAFGWTLDPLYAEFDALAVNFISYIEKWAPSEIVLYK